MTHKALRDLAASLYARRHEGVIVGPTVIKIDGWVPVQNRCHLNATRLSLLKPEYKTVHGWVAADYSALGYVRFYSHSVVEQPDGKLVDITPNPSPWRYPFIRHDEGDGDFAELVDERGIVHLDHLLTSV